MTQQNAQARSMFVVSSSKAAEEAEPRARREVAAAVLQSIAADATVAPRDYLAQTEVPEGGE